MIYNTLDTFYLSNEQISNSPSRKDGVDEETETQLRFFGCELIQEGGILLKMPQAVMATGQVLFHRFYCKKSFARFNVKRVAASCVWLAAKLEESPRKIRDVLNVFHRIECRRENFPLEPLDLMSKKYEEMKTDLIRTERHLLKEMGFICHVEHPHKFILNYVKIFNSAPELMQEAWSLANDSLRTTLCVRFKSEVVACGVVYTATRRFQVPLPENPPWWQVFDAEKSEVVEVCRVLANMYKQPKARYIEVGKDSKSFVLSSRAWDPPPDSQESLVKNMINGNTKHGMPGIDDGAGDSTTKVVMLKETVEDEEDIQHVVSNGDVNDEAVALKSIKFLSSREDIAIDRSKEKDKDRMKDRDRERERDREKERDRDRDRIRDREREREKEKEREREKLKERDYRLKDRSRDAGYSEKSRHHSSRERESLSSYVIVREKERHRHHPYA